MLNGNDASGSQERTRQVTAACDLSDEELAAARLQTRQAMAGMTGGAALQFQAQTYELAVVNPHDLARGTLHVDYATGLVCWERNVWDDLGYLPGYPIGDAVSRYVGSDTIRRALLGARLVNGHRR
jgi:hypothetical protein